MQHRALGFAAIVIAASLGAGVGVSEGATRVRAATPVVGSAFALQAQYIAAVKRVAPSVVQIQTRSGLGSGEILDTDGHIVTNAHVVGQETSFTVILSNGKRYQGALVGSFPADDLAVIKITAPKLRPIAVTSSAKLAVGSIVLAIGSPLGLQSSVSQGIVSAVGRTLNEPGGSALPGLIQTTAAINPGNSGGALVDLRGALVGIATLGAGTQNGTSTTGIGFAISSDTMSSISRQLIKNGKVVNSGRAYLGVELAEAQGQGAYVGAVEPNGPAAKAGIKAGDLITRLAGRPTPTAAGLALVLAGLQPGKTVTVSVTLASRQTRTVQIKLGEYPGS